MSRYYSAGSNRGMRSRGQAMTEYLVVTSALIGAFFIVANTDCPGYDNCISKLLTVMHDNYDGYSSSITAVQKYGDYAAVNGSSSGQNGGGSGGNGGGGGGSVGTGLNSDGLTRVTKVTDVLGFESYGNLQSDGTVTNGAGEIVGNYDEATGIFTAIDGTVDDRALVHDSIVDEEGNQVQLQAVVSCSGSPKQVYGFGYQSQVTGTFYNSSQLAEMPVPDSLCLEPTFKVLDKQRRAESGRIVDGFYYAVTDTITLSNSGMAPTGEVVYWAGLNDCSVMITDWDAGVDRNQSAEQIYTDQLRLYSEPDANLNPRLGSMDTADYVEQTAIHGVPAWPNDCVSNRTLTSP